MSKGLEGLHTLVIREHSSGSVASDMALCHAEYKHTKFGWRFYFGLLLPWHSSFFGFQVLSVQSFVSVLMKKVKYFFDWGSSFKFFFKRNYLFRFEYLISS